MNEGTAEKIDYKKLYKDLYLPKTTPSIITVPPIKFIMIEGKGAPEGEEYPRAIEALYALTFTIKMSKMGDFKPEGYFEYVVPPLEGLWWSNEERFDENNRDSWRWLSMIRQPEFVTNEVFEWAKAECDKKKPDIDTSLARLSLFDEGLCGQILHVGPYADEAQSLTLLDGYVIENGYELDFDSGRKHHEIYLSDPRRCAPEKMKTVLRHPIRKV